MLETFKKVWHFSEKRHSSFIKSLVFSFIKSAFGVTQLYAIILTIKVLLGESEPQKAIIQIIILTAICIIGNFIASYIEQTETLKTGFFMVADKRVKIADLLRKMPLGYFNNTSCGKIAATLTSTLSGVENAAAMVMVGIVSGLFNSVAFLIFMFIYDYRIGIVSSLGMVIYLGVVGYQMKLSQKNAPRLQKAQTNLADSALTFLQGIKVTKAFSFKNGGITLKDALKNSRDENIRLTAVSMPSQFAAHLVIAVFESFVLAIALLLYFKFKEITIVKTIVLMIFSFMIYASLNQAGSMLSMIGLLSSGLDEAESLENEPILKINEPIESPKGNEIEIENVSFSYGKNKVLKNISATIKENTLTAIIGPSGSGKTTLCQLIPRFRDVEEGTIKIGGANIKNIPYENLMEKISIVFQNVYLFEDTILNNIKFGCPEASLEDVIEASKKARCHDFIMSLENGYDTIVEEGGSNLSGGEKQRISIARAILKDSPIIILDEATSALDTENEQKIVEAIDELTKNKTVIMIAHRLQTIKNADQIIALDKGEIVQKGTHDKLIAEEGVYKFFIDARNEAKNWKL